MIALASELMSTDGKWPSDTRHPPLECTRGPHACSNFVGKLCILADQLSREDLRENNLKRGCFKPVSRYDMGNFQKLPKKLRKRGMIYTITFNSLPRNGGIYRALIILYICAYLLIYTYVHISRVRRIREREWGHLYTNVTEIEGQLGKFPRKGWMLCGKARARVRQISRDRGCTW